MRSAVSAWERGMEERFGSSPASLPLMVVIGAECAWSVGGGKEGDLAGEPVDVIVFAGRDHAVYGAPHGGRVELPSGQMIEPGPLAFSAPGLTGAVFFTVASTGIWRQVFPAEQAPEIPNFIKGVAVHELVHTRQVDVFDRLEQLAESQPSLADIDDDLIQNKFGTSPAYAEAMDSQKELLLAAIRAQTPEESRRLARDILEQYRQRQDAWFSGENAVFALLEDNFLTMEGVAVWFTFQVFPPDGAAGGAPLQIANYYDSKSEGAWVQAHGALFVALLDRIDTDWRQHAFDDGMTIIELLERTSGAVTDGLALGEIRLQPGLALSL